MTPVDPFARDRAKTRRKVLAGAAGIVVAAIAVSAFLWWRNPERVMEKNRAFIDETRARYCKVLENEKGTEPAARVPTPNAATGELGTYGLEMFDDYDGSSSHRQASGNLDHLQIESLEAICAGKTHPGSESLHSLFAGIVEPNPHIRARYTKKGLARAIAEQQKVEYLLVVRISQMTQTVAVGEDGLAPGRFAAYAAVWRLSDGAFAGGADVSGDGPHVAFLSRGNEDLQLKVQTDDALKRAIATDLGKTGLTLKL